MTVSWESSEVFNNISADVQNITRHTDLETLHERIAGILKEQNVSMTVREYLSSIAALTYSRRTSTTPTATSPPDVPQTSDGFSWGVIIPMGLVGLFLFAVLVCFCWQSRKDKRRLRQLLEQEFPNDDPGYETVDTRPPSRSVGSHISGGSNALQQVHTIPPLQRQHPHPRYIFHAGEETRRVGILPPRLPSIEESAMRQSLDTTDSVIAGNRMDSGRIARRTPHVAYTDDVNRRRGLAGFVNPCFSAPGRLDGKGHCDVCNALNYPHLPGTYSPTSAYDDNSDKSVLLTRGNKNPSCVGSAAGLSSVKKPPPRLDGEELSSIATFLENSHYPHALRENCHGRLSSRSISDSGTLSLPSSISRFNTSHRSNVTGYPFVSTRNCTPVRLNFTLSSSIEISDHYSDNTSLFPCVGSSCTSVWTQAASRTSPMPSFSTTDLIYDPFQSRSASAPETRHPSLNVLPTQKSCSVGVGLDMSAGSSQFSSSVSCFLSQDEPHHPTPVSNSDTWEDIYVGDDRLDENHVCDLDIMQTKKVKFTVPVLDKKQYWF